MDVIPKDNQIKLYSLFVHKLLSNFDDPYLKQRYYAYSQEKIPKLDPSFYKRMNLDIELKREKEHGKKLRHEVALQNDIITERNKKQILLTKH